MVFNFQYVMNGGNVGMNGGNGGNGCRNGEWNEWKNTIKTAYGAIFGVIRWGWYDYTIAQRACGTGGCGNDSRIISVSYLHHTNHTPPGGLKQRELHF